MSQRAGLDGFGEEKNVLSPAGIRTPDRRKLDTLRYGMERYACDTARRQARNIWYRARHVRYGTVTGP